MLLYMILLEPDVMIIIYKSFFFKYSFKAREEMQYNTHPVNTSCTLKP